MAPSGGLWDKKAGSLVGWVKYKNKDIGIFQQRLSGQARMTCVRLTQQKNEQENATIFFYYLMNYSKNVFLQQFRV